MKAKRQEKIIEIIGQFDIETQDELAAKLKEAGFHTTQATISRDIREMKLTKISFPDGKQKYIALDNRETASTEKYKRMLKDTITSIAISENILVIKTVAGMAMACGAALDHLNFEQILGTIAGDDTIMCVARSKEEAPVVKAMIQEI
ncbi:MAG: arginine repressor [Lachnospiraceae bacterium]|nr:arginine repressor [Lachnospiraceae bacterium]